MAMKYIKLWGASISMAKSLNFKWEWTVFYEGRMWSYDLQEWVWNKYQSPNYENRAQARTHIRSVFVPLNYYRNIKLKRRLVQANWVDYNDSFKWNRGCGR